MDITLLGPQRSTGAARAAVAELMPAHGIATINAGWQEREPDTAEFDDVLGGRMINVSLFARWQQLLASDPEYATAERRLTARLDAARTLYRARLAHAMAALVDVAGHDVEPDLTGGAVADCIRTLRALDEYQWQRVAAIRHDFYAEVRLGDRDSVLGHRYAIGEATKDCAGWVVAGGHVAVLLHLLHIFGLVALIRPPVIAWSAGAMALSERVMLFHDHLVDGPSVPELYAEGLGLYAGVLPLPHAKRRLHLDDHQRMRWMADRFAPRTLVKLPDGARLDLVDHEPLPQIASVVAPSPVEVI